MTIDNRRTGRIVALCSYDDDDDDDERDTFCAAPDLKFSIAPHKTSKQWHIKKEPDSVDYVRLYNRGLLLLESLC